MKRPPFAKITSQISFVEIGFEAGTPRSFLFGYRPEDKQNERDYGDSGDEIVMFEVEKILACTDDDQGHQANYETTLPGLAPKLHDTEFLPHLADSFLLGVSVWIQRTAISFSR
ncbi:MAG: hypothetical protein UY41_C0009G0032 [Candidatus Moranbacteria bacterium GW2011_GWE1_49_15]|nr:MAG: hypothetical protein UX75_C0002G0034 [Candidatus Moranbacteria bacterium GW2011_GWE2_47_10]KKW07093.1 MAG: hypothetical protein UY41_C0009G0032 [Candidatus Moranbacteria bacterium GW2011_GWE1_49_15]